MHTLQLEKLRKETPACEFLLHFNNAGASLSPQAVIDAVKNHLDLEAKIGGYEAEAAASNQSSKIYIAAAKLLNCHHEEIAFLENATRAWEMIFYSFKFKKGDRVLTCRSEYASNYLAFLDMAKRTGLVIDVINDDEYGQIDLNDLQSKINEQVKLIAITHVPTQGGLINPAKEVGEIAKKFHIPYLLDATQSIGQMPIDVQDIGCDFLCATGRKFLRGPRGTGFLYINQSKIADYHPPFVDLHAAQWVADNDYILRSDALRFETWEQNIAAKIGLGVAIEYALELGLPAIWQRIQLLAQELRQQLTAIPGIELQDLGKNKCGIVTFTYKNVSAQEIQKKLAEKKMNVSVSLQEYARLDLVKRNLPALVRSSVHYYNTEDEITRFCKAIRAIAT